jgi:hypothetical protein
MSPLFILTPAKPKNLGWGDAKILKARGLNYQVTRRRRVFRLTPTAQNVAQKKPGRAGLF